MTTAFEIPLTPQAQRILITLGGVAYGLRFTWCEPNASWIMDISDAEGNPIKLGTPLITGADLLAQFAYLGIGGAMVVQSDNDPGLVPDYASLGVTGHLYFLTEP